MPKAARVTGKRPLCVQGGAFGNDAKEIASLFREALFDKNYASRFKKVVFAIYVNPRTRSTYNYDAFKACFGEIE